MPIRKAVIPAAGFGTRFLPVSKAVPKVLLPVVDRPVIQYAVEELVRAGIDRICIVVSHGQGAISDHFSPAPELEAALEAAGKMEALASVRKPTELADIYYITQHRPLGLGHAVACARNFVGNEPFAVILPDELFDPGTRFMAEMAEVFDERQASVIAGMEVPHDHISRYGVIDAEDVTADPMKVRSLVEKPPVDKAPSDLAIVGRYVLEPEVMEILAKTEPGAIGEIQLTDALDVLARRGSLYAKRYDGRRWDVGNKQGFLKANFELAAERADLAEPVFGFPPSELT